MYMYELDENMLETCIETRSFALLGKVIANMLETEEELLIRVVSKVKKETLLEVDDDVTLSSREDES